MSLSAQAAAEYVRSRIPNRGLFAGLEWRISPTPFPLERKVVAEIEKLGRVLLQFYRAANLVYRKSHEEKLPPWVAGYLDRGKPKDILDWQRSPAFKAEIPRVIRPDILLTDDGLKITELDSVPGGIGLTAWLNQTYTELHAQGGEFPEPVGGGRSMLEGFASMFPTKSQVHIVISKESETYQPEMEWLAGQLGGRFQVRDSHFSNFALGDAVYRFFELFDVPNVKNARTIFERAANGEISVTAPPKSFPEEKLLLALLWNGNLREYWRQELGEAFLKKLLDLTPYSWIVDPAPLPPHGAIPALDLTDWQQLKTLSQKKRDLILKVSGFSENAWGARGVFLGSDLNIAEWSQAVDTALLSFPKNPWILQRYHRPRVVETEWFDFQSATLKKMDARVRLCPYFFVEGSGDQARARLCGILATICPSDKKIIHGMTEAVLAPVIAV